MAFDFIGFVLTFFLATSHSAREGARAGLGLTLIRYGTYVHDHGNDPDGMKSWEEELEREVEEEAERRKGTGGNGGNVTTNGTMATNGTMLSANGTVALPVAPTNATAEPLANATAPVLNVTLPLNTTTNTLPLANLTLPPLILPPNTTANGTVSLFARSSPMGPSPPTSLIGLMLIVLGWLLLFKSIVSFLRVRRMERLALFRAGNGTGVGAVEGGVEGFLSRFTVWPGSTATMTEDPAETMTEEAREEEREGEVVRGEIALDEEEGGERESERPRWWLRSEV
jgi:hypothetical protein